MLQHTTNMIKQAPQTDYGIPRTLREQYRLGVFENKVFRISKPKTGKLKTG